jgi:biopolymer transport protein ExbD
MGRFTRSSRDENDETKVDISPLIDCVFILLIFFIVTTTFVEEKGMAVDKSQASANPNPSENESVTLVLPGQREVLFEGVNIGVGGVRPLVQRRAKKSDMPVILQVGESVPLSFLTLVRDEVNLGGAKQVNYVLHKGSR